MCTQSCSTSLRTLATKIYPPQDSTRRIGRCLVKVAVAMACKMEALEDGDAFFKKQAFREVGVDLSPRLEAWRQAQAIHAIHMTNKGLLAATDLGRAPEIPRRISSTALIRREPRGVADVGKAMLEGAMADTVRMCFATTLGWFSRTTFSLVVFHEAMDAAEGGTSTGPELARQTTEMFGRISDKWGGIFDSNSRGFEKKFCSVWVSCDGGIGARSLSDAWGWDSGT